MKLLKIEIENYKSLKKVIIDNLAGLNLFAGPNGAGKTNLSDALGFLGDVFRDGLKKTIANYGGFENICYVGEEEADYIIFDVSFASSEYIFRYHFNISSSISNGMVNYEIQLEELLVSTSAGKLELSIKSEIDLYENDRCTAVQPATNIEDSFLMKVCEEIAVNRYLNYQKVKEDELLIFVCRLLSKSFAVLLSDTLEKINIYQINSYMCRQGGTLAVVSIGKHGENTPTALKLIKESKPEIYKQIENFMKQVLPDLEEIKVILNSDRTYGIEFKEVGVKRWWNVKEVSDGTLRILSMLIALADPNSKVVAIEEPENSIHPRLLLDFYDFCKEVSKYKQLFITTHSTVLLNALREDDAVYIVYRSKRETKVKSILDFEGAKESLEYELVGDFIFTGGIKEYMPWYLEVQDEE